MTPADDPIQKVPQVLKQKCALVEDSIGKLDGSRPEDTTSKEQGRAKGRILTWRGLDIGYAWVRGPKSSEITIYRYANGTADARKLLHQDFGELTNVVDAVYFPLSANFPGVIVAVRELGSIRRSFLAYISLRSAMVLDYRYMAGDVTCIHSAIDGIGAESGDLRALANSFHSWPHVLVVGCKSSSAWLMHMNIDAKDAALVEEKGVQAEKREPPKGKLKGSIPLLGKFIDRQGKFVVRDEVQGCVPYPADQVLVSALSYIDKCHLVVLGFNIGCVALVSLKSSMIEQVFLADGIIEYFAVQEPEEESRPMFYLWSTLRMEKAGGRRLMAIMHVINFRQSDSMIPRELWSYDDPKLRFLFHWWLPQCDRMLVMRTVVKPRGRSPERRDSSSSVWSGPGDSNAHDTSQVLMVWLDELTSSGHPIIRGSLYDLNAHYAKRLTSLVAEDGTIARQIPFFSLFKAAGLPSSQVPLDVVVTSTSPFAATATLREPTDQLFYASSFSIAANCLTSAALLKVGVQSLQQQLVVDIAANMPRYFDKPRPACQWAHSIGLVSSVPSMNLNEERVCLLRVLANYYFPAVLQLVDHLEDSEGLKFVHKWVWKEVEIARDRLDELTSNILSHTASELSPAVTRFIHHSRVIFTRASMVLTALQSRVGNKFEDDDGWLRSIAVQLQAVRQVKLYASGLSFTLHCEMLPSKSGMIDAYKRCAEELTKRAIKLRARGLRKVSEVHAIVAEVMRLHASDPVWGGKSSAEEWCASLNFVGLLPLLLFLDVSEIAKLTLVGSYLLELAPFLVKPVQKRIFQKAMSFLAPNNEFTLNEPRRIRSLWESEKRLSKMEESALRLLLGSEAGQDPEGGIASTPMRVPLYTPHPSIRANAPRPDETPMCASASTTPVPTPTPTPGTLRMKDWERVNRVTRTPLSARKEAISTTPMLQHTLQPTPQPILKSPARKEGVSQATREVTAERPKRLQFAQVLSAVKPIPSRAQGRQEEGVNTSLTNFGYFSGTDQSSSTKHTPSSADASSIPMNSPRVAMAARAVEREVEPLHSEKHKEPAEESHSPVSKRSKTASYTATANVESAEVEPPHLEEREEGRPVEESRSPLRKRSETASHATYVDPTGVERPHLEKRKEPVEQNQSPLRTRSKTPSHSPKVDVPPSQSPPRRASKRIAERRARSANATPNAKDGGGVTKRQLSPTPTKPARSVSASATKKQQQKKAASPARVPTAKGQKGRG